MKKLTAILIALMLLVLCICACSSNGNYSETSFVISNNSSHQSANTSLDFSVSETDEISKNFSETINDNTSIPDESSPLISEPDISTPETSIPDESTDISQPDASYPEISEPETSEPSHTCTFVKGKTTAPTCTDKGYTLYSCSCGKSEKRDYTSALGHSWSDWETIKEPTTTSTGVEQRYCTRSGCDASETRVLDKLPSDKDKYNVPATAANAKLVEERVLYYLNKYRNEDGVSSATFLWDGKTYKYAKARAEQIVYNFNHDRQDIIEVCNELKFGEYCLDWGDGTGCLVEPYYYGGCSEAITGPYGATESCTVDDLALDVAANIHASSGHWNYVGAETTKHITVGCYAFVWGNEADFYFCIATSSTNKYD